MINNNTKSIKKVNKTTNKEDGHIYKRHNKSLLLYHLVIVVKYRKSVITENVENTIKDTCIKISNIYEIRFIEIGFDNNQMHLLVQGIPDLSISKMVNILKGIIAREVFKLHKDIKEFLWGNSFFSSGYYINTVGEYSNKEIIKKYIQNQGKESDINEYKQIYVQQLEFDFMK
jgi:REP element-mobilizing transposase RayT